MEVILLERIAKLGQMGDVVRVRDGFGRNFLLPQGKALRATDENRARFEQMKSELEARNLERRSEAEKVAEKLNGQSFVAIRQAADTGQLYGSVSTRDIVALLEEEGFRVERSQVVLNTPIKAIGMYTLAIALHPEVDSSVSVTVARSTEEAERIARGEDVLARRDEIEEEEEVTAEEAAAAAQAFFEPEAAQRQDAAGTEAAEEAEPA
jgi:large subunit ribosomal protein L9